ncbi:MAG: hypothetical protein V4450_03745 [Bacteroidota bacterium]
MRKLFCCLFLLFTHSVFASDSLRVVLSASKLVKNDTLDFSCAIPAFKELRLTNATLNVWIEDVAHTKRWKYRYPIINGEVSGSLAVGNKIPDGVYAVNFLVQPGFFKISGEVYDHDKRDTSIIYMMISKNKKGSYLDYAHVARDGFFHLKNTLFADSAYFVFAPMGKTKSNYLDMRIETPLDSVFTPVLQETKFITIGNPAKLLAGQTDTSHYLFRSDNAGGAEFLPEVVVKSKFKSKIQQYDEEYSSGLFQNNDAIVFDGLDQYDIARAPTIMMFLQGRIAGLTIERNSEGVEIAKWRNQLVEIYIDEFRLDATENLFIVPSEVAMIKAYRPPAHLSSFSGGAGAIAIYTKRGNYMSNSRFRHNFIVKGYTNMESVWQ